MSRIFCIMGKSASGKDKIYKALMQDETLRLNKIVTYTTRPIREKEEDGREYHFVSQETFEEMKHRGEVIEFRKYDTYFGPWYYFTADDGQIDLDTQDYLIINTLEALGGLQAFFGKEKVVPLYVEVEDGERLLRAITREQKQAQPAYEEMCRRFLADAEDFSEEKLKAADVGE
ncbi:MAG: guanylate kinase, partial [Lachnospiraceae bacterium]|nr:guanylate kinase [Lachnospiraceae bacterium]